MLRRVVIQYHTIVLALASMSLLVAPDAILTGLGFAAPGYSVLSLTRVVAGLLAVLAASVLFIPELPARVRGRALMAVTLSYSLCLALVLMQQIAIWNTLLGWGIVAELALHVAGFAWCTLDEYRYPAMRA